MDFEKVCMFFSMQEPFYGIILSSMERVAVGPPHMDTIGVERSGNVFRLYYNPAFINNLPLDTVLQILKHECMHIAFNHFTIWDDPDGFVPPDEIHNIRNISGDLEINGYIDRAKVSKEAGGVFAEDYGWDNFEGTREYFNKLKTKLEQSQQKAIAKLPQQACNGGQGGKEQNEGDSDSNNPQNQQQEKPKDSNPTSEGQREQEPREIPGSQPNPQPQDSGQQQENNGGNPIRGNSGGLSEQQKQNQQAINQATDDFFNQFKPFDDHSKWPTDMTKGEEEQMQQTIDDLLNFAAEEVEKARGTIPGELVGRIEKIRKKPKPVTDWKRYFRRYLGNEFTDLIRKSKKRESTRFPDAAGNRHQRKSHIIVAIDTSGSVSMPEYMEFMGQLKTLQSRASFRVLECDTRIVHEYEYKNKPNEVLHGGGGTDFQPVIDYFNKNKRKYDALVYFTDGYCDIPKDTPKETLWVISSSGDKNRKKYKVNGASVVFIPKHQ